MAADPTHHPQIIHNLRGWYFRPLPAVVVIGKSCSAEIPVHFSTSLLRRCPHEILASQSSRGTLSLSSGTMVLPRSNGMVSWLAVWSTLVALLSLNVSTALAASDKNITWIKYTGNDGTILLNDDRKPSLYTQQFGDCQGDSLINVTRFDAAYYKDNMTVLFHLEGNSALTNESLMSKWPSPRLEW